MRRRLFRRRNVGAAVVPALVMATALVLGQGISGGGAGDSVVRVGSGALAAGAADGSAASGAGATGLGGAAAACGDPSACPPGMVTIRPTQASVDAAARYAAAHGYAAGIAVIDMQSGSTFASDGAALYSTESVSKLFIAARLRVDGPWTPDVAALAHTMIAQSDDDAANALYEQVGGDDVMNWVMSHYALPDLGEGPARPNWWGLFHVRPRALAQLLVDLRRDGQVWPWLGVAMQATTRIAGDGFDQSFGIRQVDAGAPVKQGWAYDYSLPSSPAALNTTGFVADGRYAVVVMVRGSHGSYPQGIATMTTAVTSLALGTAPRS